MADEVKWDTQFETYLRRRRLLDPNDLGSLEIEAINQAFSDLHELDDVAGFGDVLKYLYLEGYNKGYGQSSPIDPRYFLDFVDHNTAPPLTAAQRERWDRQKEEAWAAYRQELQIKNAEAEAERAAAEKAKIALIVHLDRSLRNDITTIIHEGPEYKYKLSRKNLTDESTTELLITYPADDKDEPNRNHQLCDDESPLMFAPIEDNHVNLGFGVCLNKEDIEGMESANPVTGFDRKYTNPLTRQPFTPLQNLAAKVLLMGGKVRYIRQTPADGKKRRLEASMLKLHV